MAVYESLLKYLAEYGSVQLRMEVYDIQSMEVYGTVWKYKAMYGKRWKCSSNGT